MHSSRQTFDRIEVVSSSNLCLFTLNRASVYSIALTGGLRPRVLLVELIHNCLLGGRAYETDAVLLHLTLGGLQAFLALVHRLCGVVDDERLDACFGGVDCGRLDTVVEREAADEHHFDAIVLEVLGKAAHRDLGLAKGWPKAGVGLDARVATLLDDLVDENLVELG